MKNIINFQHERARRQKAKIDREAEFLASFQSIEENEAGKEKRAPKITDGNVIYVLPFFSFYSN